MRTHRRKARPLAVLIRNPRTPSPLLRTAAWGAALVPAIVLALNVVTFVPAAVVGTSEPSGAPSPPLPTMPLPPDVTIPMPPTTTTPVTVDTKAPQPPEKIPPPATTNSPAPDPNDPLPAGRRFAIDETTDGDAILWPACTPFRWRYNPSGEPAGAVDAIRRALGEISAASGIEMIELGTSSLDVANPDDALAELKDGEVIIGYAPIGSTAIADTQVAGSATTSVSDDRILKGSIALNVESAAELPRDFSPGGSFGALVLHEVGHVIGLQHVDDPTQIMTPALNSKVGRHLGSGDRSGLAVLAGRSC